MRTVKAIILVILKVSIHRTISTLSFPLAIIPISIVLQPSEWISLIKHLPFSLKSATSLFSLYICFNIKTFPVQHHSLLVSSLSTPFLTSLLYLSSAFRISGGRSAVVFPSQKRGRCGPKRFACEHGAITKIKLIFFVKKLKFMFLQICLVHMPTLR